MSQAAPQVETDEAAVSPEMDDTGVAAIAGGPADDQQQFVSFTVGAEEYGIDIMQVREIKGWTEVTALPNQPSYMRGVMNLRGVIVPIYDMRARFTQGMTDATATHVVIIGQVRDKTIGILVDAVSDILTVRDDQICPIPEVEQSENARFLEGMVTVNERMVAVMSLEKLIQKEAMDFGDVAADAA